MKYFLTIIAALALAGYAFVKGASINDGQNDHIMSPCAPQSIASAKNPDARYSHCQDKDWDGSTLLRDRLAEAQAHPDMYGIILESNHIPQLMVPDGMTTDDDSEPLTLTEKPSPTHRGSL